MATRFPLYLMKINDKMQFLPLEEAGVQFNSGYSRVAIGELVLLESYEARHMTTEDRRQIAAIADSVSSSK